MNVNLTSKNYSIQYKAGNNKSKQRGSLGFGAINGGKIVAGTAIGVLVIGGGTLFGLRQKYQDPLLGESAALHTDNFEPVKPSTSAAAAGISEECKGVERYTRKDLPDLKPEYLIKPQSPWTRIKNVFSPQSQINTDEFLRQKCTLEALGNRQSLINDCVSNPNNVWMPVEKNGVKMEQCVSKELLNPVSAADKKLLDSVKICVNTVGKQFVASRSSMTSGIETLCREGVRK